METVATGVVLLVYSEQPFGWVLEEPVCGENLSLRKNFRAMDERFARDTLCTTLQFTDFPRENKNRRIRVDSRSPSQTLPSVFFCLRASRFASCRIVAAVSDPSETKQKRALNLIFQPSP